MQYPYFRFLSVNIIFIIWNDFPIWKHNKPERNYFKITTILTHFWCKGKFPNKVNFFQSRWFFLQAKTVLNQSRIIHIIINTPFYRWLKTKEEFSEFPYSWLVWWFDLISFLNNNLCVIYLVLSVIDWYIKIGQLRIPILWVTLAIKTRQDISDNLISRI